MSTTRVRVLVFSTLALLLALLAACGTAATLTPTISPSLATTFVAGLTTTAVASQQSVAIQQATAVIAATTAAAPTPTLSQDELRATSMMSAATVAAGGPTWTPMQAGYIVVVVTATPGPTLSSRQLQATAIIQGATETMLGYTWTPFATSTPYPSATPCMTAGGCPTPVLDHDQMRATQIIEGATATAAMILTGTRMAELSPMLDADQVRATQMIAGATATIGALQTATQRAIEAYTPPPTLTSDELQGLHERWLDELETAAGFSHPVFEEVVDGLVQTAPDAYAEYLRNFHMQPEIERTEYEGSTYVALIVEPEFILAGSRRLLLFRLTDDGPVLLPDVLNTGFYYYITFSGVRFGHDGDLGGFADRNGNGYPDLAIDTDSNGSCGVQAMQVLEIRPDDRVMNLSPITMQHLGDSAPRDFVDLEGDGILEIVVATYSVAPTSYGCHIPAMIQYYAWDGTAYQNISPTLDESYYPAIDQYWSSIDREDVCLLPDQPMYQMLIDYIALGRLEEGWLRLQRVLHWERCPGDLTDFQRDHMLSLVAWVGSHLPIATPTP